MKATYAMLIVVSLLLAVLDAWQGKMLGCTAMLLCALVNIFGLMNYMDGGRPA